VTQPIGRVTAYSRSSTRQPDLPVHAAHPRGGDDGLAELLDIGEDERTLWGDPARRR
jgi:hypothetical protein